MYRMQVYDGQTTGMHWQRQKVAAEHYREALRAAALWTNDSAATKDAARLEPEELKRMLDAGERVFIVDLRHPLELLPDPFMLPGAQYISPEALAARQQEIPRDRDIELFCTCPSEATSARTAMILHKLGIERVRPLRGGFDEWKRLGFPLEAVKRTALA